MKPPPATTEARPSYSRTRRVLVVLGAAFVLYGAIGWLAVPPLAKKLIVDKAGEKLGRVVQVEKVSVNPYTLYATVNGVRVLEADGRTVFASFDSLDIDGSMRSLTQLAPVADEVTLTGLKVRLVRDGESHYNVSDILARLAAAPAQAKAKEGDEPRFSVSNIRLAGASIEVDDRPKGVVHRVTDLDIAIPFISSLPSHLKEYVQPRLSANVNGAPLRIRGETLPFENSLRTHIALRLDGFDVKRYASYSPTPLPVEVKSGMLGGNIAIRFTQSGGKGAAIDVSGRLSLDDVAIATRAGEEARIAHVDAEIASFDPLGGTGRVTALRADGLQAGADPWRVAAVEAGDIALDLHAKKVAIGSLATRGGELALHRAADGTLQMPLRMQSATPAPGPDSTPWLVTLGRATIDDYRVTLADGAVKPAATHRVSITHVEGHELTTAPGAKNAVDARIALDKGGLLDVRSTLVLDPLAVDAQVEARGIDLVPLRPYVEQFQTVALKSGRASAKGHLQVRGEGRALRLAYTGSAEVARLATFDTVNKEDLLNWESVRAGGLTLKWGADESLDLAVADIAVHKAYSRVVVMPDGHINLQTLKTATPEDPAPAPPSPGDAKPRNVRIDRITFADSRLNFTDHFIKPNYTADVGELSGSVTGLSSDPATRGKVDLKGSWDKSSPVLIAGTINPLSGDLFLDIAAKGKDIELPRLSAYSMRYAGYGITKGRLTLDVRYHVEDGKLDGRNRILLDQLTFGDKVESPEATKLPVLFAVNLLKDSQGRIDLELPIKGSLEDPQFDMGGLIVQVVGSLFKKALTSPFSLLTAALGTNGSAGDAGTAGSDDLAFIAFDPGGAEPAKGEQPKLDRISKALLDRPGVSIQMASSVDADKDGTALRRAALRARLAQVKGAPVDDADYPRYLKAAYEKEFGAPKAEAKQGGKPKEPMEPTAQEMEAQLMARIPVGEPQLQALAARRAQWVKDYLVTQGRLPEARVLTAAADAPAGERAAHLSRVDFTLK